MRLLFTIGPLIIIDVTLFRIDLPEEQPDVLVVHHEYSDDEDKDDGPGDLFGGNK